MASLPKSAAIKNSDYSNDYFHEFHSVYFDEQESEKLPRQIFTRKVPFKAHPFVLLHRLHRFQEWQNRFLKPSRSVSNTNNTVKLRSEEFRIAISELYGNIRSVLFPYEICRKNNPSAFGRRSSDFTGRSDAGIGKQVRGDRMCHLR